MTLFTKPILAAPCDLDGCQYGKLIDILAAALDEHESVHGRFAKTYMPHHWTHQARKVFGREESSTA